MIRIAIIAVTVTTKISGLRLSLLKVGATKSLVSSRTVVLASLAATCRRWQPLLGKFGSFLVWLLEYPAEDLTPQHKEIAGGGLHRFEPAGARPD